MAKPFYKIPNSLDKSMLDQEISLSKSAHMPTVPLKVITFYLGSLLGLFWVVSSTFVNTAGLGLIVIFVIWWVLATVYFGSYSKTKELRLMAVPALLQYIPKASRKILTRRASNASGFYGISGVKRVDEDGHVTFLDGTVGRAYLVVGSASALVFEADMHQILNRVDAFYRKVDTTSEYLWITTKEPQRVFRQLANQERRNLRLEVRDPELFALLDEQASILRDHVGSEYHSIHQYLVVKAVTEEALLRSHALLESEVRDSSLMIKTCTSLDGEGFTEMSRAIYANAA